MVYHNYGTPDELKLAEVATPIPSDDQVLVKIYASSVNAADWHLLTADIFLVRFYAGLLKPKRPIIGADVAGRVEAVGKNIRQFRPGDKVYGDVFPYGGGGFAEYVAITENALAPKPTNLTFEEAAAVPLAAVTALQGLRDQGQLQPGQKVVINGASGGVGTFAVQIAKALGGEVTAVCSPGKMDMVRALGADHVIDYTKEDFTQNGQQYDLIVAANGYYPLSAYERALRPKGIYVMIGGSKQAQLFQALLLGPWKSMMGDKKMGALTAKTTQADLLYMKELIEAGKVAPVIDRRYPLEKVPDALRYLGEGHAKGKIVISVRPDSA